MLVVNKELPSVWASVESYCLCRDLEYAQYLEIQSQHSKAAPLSPDGYAALGLVFFEEMTRDYD